MDGIHHNSNEMLHRDITEQIIRCAYTVYNKMGFVYLESVYERCLAIELGMAGLRVEFQKPFSVQYDGAEVGFFVADALIENKVMLELKSVRTLAPAHEAQLVNYLKATGVEVGLLTNFGEHKVEVRRKLRVLPTAVPHPVHPVHPIPPASPSGLSS